MIDLYLWTTNTASCRHLQICRRHMYGNSVSRPATEVEMKTKPVCEDCRNRVADIRAANGEAVDKWLAYYNEHVLGTSRHKEMGLISP